MFIKFSDKTKNIMVKKSKEDSEELENSEENTIYLDDSDAEEENDIRLKILKQYENK